MLKAKTCCYSTRSTLIEEKEFLALYMLVSYKNKLSEEPTQIESKNICYGITKLLHKKDKSR